MELSDKLYKLQNTAAFEIRARALWMAGERKKAIQILEQGVQAGPYSYVLWDYLASFYSDQAWYDQALEAYAKALDCPDCERTATLCNMAFVYQRSGRDDKCVETLKDLDCKGHVIELMIVSTLAHSLSQIGKAQDALDLVQNHIDALRPDNENAYLLYTERGWAQWKLGNNEKALEDAHHALELSKHAARAAELIREITGIKSPTARKLLLYLKGVAPAAPGADSGEPFMLRWYVVAESPQEALDLIRTQIPESLADTLTLEKYEDEGSGKDNPLGVYGVTEGWDD